MTLPQTFLVGTSLCFVLAVAAALVARGAAVRARAYLRDLQYQMDRIESEFLGVTIRLRRVEGRQTARMGRDSPKNSSGLPDPSLDPEGWRAAVRRIQVHSKKEGSH